MKFFNFFFILRRSLTDTSNVYLDQTISSNNNKNNENSSNKKIQIENSDDEDALLSQALDEQEAKINATLNNRVSPAPPAKKVSIFLLFYEKYFNLIKFLYFINIKFIHVIMFLNSQLHTLI